MAAIYDTLHWFPVTAVIVFLLVSFKLYVKWTTGMYHGKERLEGKTIIVTGANTGIGKVAAQDLARRGARVILACRDLTKANAARDEIVAASGNHDVVVRELDLASLASVRAFARDVIKTERRLDVLVNNAGAGGLPDTITADGLQLGMQINHFGPFLLTNLLLDLLKKSAPSRIIFLTSIVVRHSNLDLDDLNFKKSFNQWMIYCNSKMANLLTSNELARRLEGTGVTSNSVHPGLVVTEIFRNVWYGKVCDFVYGTFFKNVDEGAQTTIYAAVSDEVAGVTGKYFEDCKEKNMSPKAKDLQVAKTLWERSEDFVKLK